MGRWLRVAVTGFEEHRTGDLLLTEMVLSKAAPSGVFGLVRWPASRLRTFVLWWWLGPDHRTEAVICSLDLED
jgi:hypothetical protein